MKYLLAILLLACIAVSATAQAKQPKKEWAFVEKKDGTMHKFAQGQKVKVVWQGISGIKTSRGALENITSDSVTLIVDKVARNLGNKDIVEIALPHKNALDMIDNVLTFILGIVVIGIAILIQVILTVSRTDSQLAAGEKSYFWVWSFLGVGLIALALARSPQNERIEQPFGQGCTLEETTIQGKNLP